MLEILNSGMYASPIIVFVNQKKTADMVAKDLQRAGVSKEVSSHLGQLLTAVFSGALRRCTQARTKSSEKPPCNHCARAMQISWSRQILQAVVSMYKMSVWSSITRWPTLSRPMSTVLVGLLSLM